MSTIAELAQAGQPDLELAAVTTRVLLAPYNGTAPLTTLEDSAGGLDKAKIGRGVSPFATVGNYEKKAGVKLSNKPTMNKIMSAGYGSPTRQIASEAEKSIAYSPQETNLVNLQNAWGFTPDAVQTSASGGITIGIPELPANLLWRAVLLTADTYNGLPLYMYWIMNRVDVGDRQDINAVDSDVFVHGVTLNATTDPAVGLPVIFGICGPGWAALKAATDSGFDPAITAITATPSSVSVTAATGVSHTKSVVVKDSNGNDVTAAATWSSSDPTKATADAGTVTGVAAGSATVTATYRGFTADITATVT